MLMKLTPVQNISAKQNNSSKMLVMKQGGALSGMFFRNLGNPVMEMI